MVYDAVFRLVFIGLFASVMTMRLYFRYRGGLLFEGAVRELRREVRWLLGLRCVLGLPWFFAALCWIFRPQWVAWSMMSLPLWLRSTGLLLATLGLVVLWWSHRALGRNFSATPRIRSGHVLVVNGPYQWVRHPMYVAFLTMLLGAGLLADSWFLGLTGPSLIVAAMILRTPREEEQLEATFGEAYREYVRRTGAFLPRLAPRAVGRVPVLELQGPSEGR